jgi:hypothetical protein
MQMACYTILLVLSFLSPIDHSMIYSQQSSEWKFEFTGTNQILEYILYISK